MQRRTLLAAGGVGLIAVLGAGGATRWLTPREARLTGAGLKVLSHSEQATLEAFGEALLPGARHDGVAHFVDDQLAKPPAECLLMLRYFDWPPPYTDFYKGGLAALDGYARLRFARPFAELGGSEADAVIREVSSGKSQGWKGPPAQLVFLAVRSDAVDVVYGTVEGFNKLDIPYMPHIEPLQKW